jgi:hypothetical protein
MGGYRRDNLVRETPTEACVFYGNPAASLGQGRRNARQGVGPALAGLKVRAHPRRKPVARRSTHNAEFSEAGRTANDEHIATSDTVYSRQLLEPPA